MTTIIVPGLNNSGPGHWQSRWQESLPSSVRVQQGDWDRAVLDLWLSALVARIRANPGAILVGHSLGAVLIAHMAAARPDLPVGGALLVAPADVEATSALGRHLRRVTRDSFSPVPLSPLPFPSILVASRNDPHMRFARARALARMWDAAFVDAGRSGHINVASGHGHWPEGLELLERLRDLSRFQIEAPLLSPFRTAASGARAGVPEERPASYRAGRLQPGRLDAFAR